MQEIRLLQVQRSINEIVEHNSAAKPDIFPSLTLDDSTAAYQRQNAPSGSLPMPMDKMFPRFRPDKANGSETEKNYEQKLLSQSEISPAFSKTLCTAQSEAKTLPGYHRDSSAITITSLPESRSISTTVTASAGRARNADTRIDGRDDSSPKVLIIEDKVSNSGNAAQLSKRSGNEPHCSPRCVL